MDRIHLLNKQLSRLNNHLDRLNQKSNRLSWIRLAIILAGFIIITLALILSDEILSGIAIFTILIVFSIASFIHNRFKLSVKKFSIWQLIKNEHLNRTLLNWSSLPTREYSPDSRHPFEVDLDISGNYSLHRLIDNSNSKNASKRLLDWFRTEEPNPEIISLRQKLIQELIPLHRFRDKLILQAKLASNKIFDGNKFLQWMDELDEGSPGRFFLIILFTIAFINIILFSMNFFGLIKEFYLISLVVYILLYLSRIKIISRLFWQAIGLTDEIHKISSILIFLEKYPLVQSGQLKDLLNPIRQPSAKPSKHLRKLHTILSLFGIRANIVIQFIVNIVLPVDYILADIFIHIKKKLVDNMPVWLDCWYELETLSSMANFAWLNPDYTFPQFNNNQAIITCHKLGHPLIPRKHKRTNDFNIKNRGDIALITGSNMSGKSTFLRTIGINICLAQAGSVVDAEMMTLRYLRLFTCIKIDDNLAEGLSYFYAEVKRLKQLLTLLEAENEYPLYYLIDEIYKGTNNQERLAGSKAFIKSLTDKNGAGIVSTHDLELTRLESDLDSLQNFHFHEHIEDSKMVFDFKLRKGPCPTTNALIIMKKEGLPI